MEYKFAYKNTAADFWQMSLYHIYGSLVGVVNLVFTFAMIVLSITMWGNAHLVFKVLLVIACFYFPVIQPLLLYLKGVRQAEETAKNTILCFNEEGVDVEVDLEHSHLHWSEIAGLMEKRTMVIVFSSKNRGYVIPNSVMGDRRQAFCNFVNERLAEHRRESSDKAM